MYAYEGHFHDHRSEDLLEPVKVITYYIVYIFEKNELLSINLT